MRLLHVFASLALALMASLSTPGAFADGQRTTRTVVTPAPLAPQPGYRAYAPPTDRYVYTAPAPVTRTVRTVVVRRDVAPAPVASVTYASPCGCNCGCGRAAPAVTYVAPGSLTLPYDGGVGYTITDGGYYSGGSVVYSSGPAYGYSGSRVLSHPASRYTFERKAPPPPSGKPCGKRH